jgi:GUN4-like
MSGNNVNSGYTAIIVALITVLGTLGVGVFSNWKDIFPINPTPSPTSSLNASTNQISPTSTTSDKFNQLRKSLGEPDWRRADKETGKILVESETINPIEINQISCQDLKETDKLWSANSGGRFGLTSQMKKWEDSGGNGVSFAVSVGWQKADGSSITYDKMLQRFSLSSSNGGQLPRRYLWKFNKQSQFQQFFDKFRSCGS